MIITSGQHRNEKSAVVIAPLVANSLRDLGYEVLLFFNPERRTLLEIARDAYNSGKKINKAEVERLLYEWEDEQIPRQYPEVPIFQFHNYGLNPTDFVPAGEHYPELESINTIYGSMDVGKFKGDELAYQLKYCRDRTGTLIEIPEITETQRNPDEIKMLRKVFHHRTFTIYRTYFLSTNLQRTREEDLMNGRVVQILAYGIDHLLRTGCEDKMSAK